MRRAAIVLAWIFLACALAAPAGADAVSHGGTKAPPGGIATPDSKTSAGGDAVAPDHKTSGGRPAVEPTRLDAVKHSEPTPLSAFGVKPTRLDAVKHSKPTPLSAFGVKGRRP